MMLIETSIMNIVDGKSVLLHIGRHVARPLLRDYHLTAFAGAGRRNEIVRGGTR